MCFFHIILDLKMFSVSIKTTKTYCDSIFNHKGSLGHYNVLLFSKTIKIKIESVCMYIYAQTCNIIFDGESF